MEKKKKQTLHFLKRLMNFTTNDQHKGTYIELTRTQSLAKLEKL